MAFAINDEKLLDLVNRSYHSERLPQNQRNALIGEMEARGKFQQVHTRIAELLDETTKQKRKK